MSLFQSRVIRRLMLASLSVFGLLPMMASRVLAAEGLPNFADLVENNAATIVEIAAVHLVESQNGLSLQDLDELFRNLPEDRRPELAIPEEESPQLQERGAVGSGFIISPDGYIITNHHVVAGSEEVTVELTDRREFRAQIVGLDEPSDLALLKIQADGLPYVSFGDSDRLRVGEWVLAIGSPFGLEFSAAAGIVSAKGRSMGQSSYNYMSFIQSDVAINQGNSGGPLFNMEGEVIGINSQILSSSGGSNGISFSIPSNVALNVISQLRDSGQVQRGLLGVLIKAVSFPLAESFGLDRPHGAFVDEVQPDSPAAAAGLQVDDIVLEFAGRVIEDSADLPFYVGQNKPGTRADLVVFRDGKRLNMKVTLGSSPTNLIVEATPGPLPGRDNPLGLSVANLNRDGRGNSPVSGVRVTAVEPGPAREAGIQDGDIIVSLNRQTITSVEQFNSVAGQLPASGFVPLRIIQQNGQGTTLALELN